MCVACSKDIWTTERQTSSLHAVRRGSSSCNECHVECSGVQGCKYTADSDGSLCEHALRVPRLLKLLGVSSRHIHNMVPSKANAIRQLLAPSCPGSPTNLWQHISGFDKRNSCVAWFCWQKRCRDKSDCSVSSVVSPSFVLDACWRWGVSGVLLGGEANFTRGKSTTRRQSPNCCVKIIPKRRFGWTFTGLLG